MNLGSEQITLHLNKYNSDTICKQKKITTDNLYLLVLYQQLSVFMIIFISLSIPLDVISWCFALHGHSISNYSKLNHEKQFKDLKKILRGSKKVNINVKNKNKKSQARCFGQSPLNHVDNERASKRRSTGYTTGLARRPSITTTIHARRPSTTATRHTRIPSTTTTNPIEINSDVILKK